MKLILIIALLSSSCAPEKVSNKPTYLCAIYDADNVYTNLTLSERSLEEANQAVTKIKDDLVESNEIPEKSTWSCILDKTYEKQNN